MNYSLVWMNVLLLWTFSTVQRSVDLNKTYTDCMKSCSENSNMMPKVYLLYAGGGGTWILLGVSASLHVATLSDLFDTNTQIQNPRKRDGFLAKFGFTEQNRAVDNGNQKRPGNVYERNSQLILNHQCCRSASFLYGSGSFDPFMK